MVLLDLVTLVSSSVQRKFSSLSESLLTSVNSANVRLLIRMNAFMLLAVLVEGKSLVTEFTWKGLVL